MGFRTPAHSRFLFMGSYLTRHSKVSAIVTVAMLMVIGVYCVFRPEKAHTISPPSIFTVVLDCGSTGTRISVYEWLRNSTNSKDQPVLLHSFPDNSSKNPLQLDACQYHCFQTEPGLDKFVHNVSGLNAALEPLLLWAEHQIPSERHKETPIFLLATAGLRRLPSEDSGWVLKNAEDVLMKHPFIHRRSWIRVLSGQEEAHYGWVALNYNLGRLRNSLEVPTFGILDLGGSSLQVVKETGGSRDSQHFVESEVGVVEHHLLAYALPAFGLNAAFDRSIIKIGKDQLAKGNADAVVKLRHPCLNSGFAQNYTCYGCDIWLDDIDLLNVSHQMQSNESMVFYLVGDPDWEQCKLLARAATAHSSNSDWSQLSADMACDANSPSSNSFNVLNLTIPRPAVHFHALSGFFAVYSMLKLHTRANMTEVLEKGQKLCSTSWEDMNKIYGMRHYMEQSCFRVPYLVSLIKDGLCLNDAEVTFGPGDVSWTLGAALVEGGYLWSSKTGALNRGANSKKLKVISSTMLLVTLFLCCIAIICYQKIKGNTALSIPTSVKKGPAVGSSLLTYIYPKRQLELTKF